jgi:hypothetical protein
MSIPIIMLINFVIQDVLTGKIKNEKAEKYISSKRRLIKKDFMILQNRLKILTDEIFSYRRKLFDKDLVTEFDCKFVCSSYYCFNLFLINRFMGTRSQWKVFDR